MADEQMNALQQNLIARQIVLNNSVKMMQPLPAQSVDIDVNNVLNIVPRNVGLTMGFLVKVSATAHADNTALYTRTPYGVANMVSNITYTDLNNVQRVQTTGYHLALLNSARQGFVFGGAYAPNVPMGYGNNWNAFSGPATVQNADAELQAYYWVPLAYSATDLRGAVYTNIVNATQQLQITLNRNAFTNNAGSIVNSVYRSAGAGNTMEYTTPITVTVYQVYRDQIPMQNGIPVLPLMDLNLVYDIKNATMTGVAENQDFPFAYPNMREFLSTFAIYNNGNDLNAGEDINYWELQSANSTQLWRMDPTTAALLARQTFMADPPLGTYYFDSRDKPISTITFGNMTLNLNASDVQANAQMLVLTEAFQQVNQIPYASSLQVAA